MAEASGARDVFQITKAGPRRLLAAMQDVFTVDRGRYPFSVKFTGDTVIVNPGRWQQIGHRVGHE